MRYDLTPHADALRLAAQAIDSAQRGTGRTGRMIEQVKNGDAVICSRIEVGDITRRLRERGVRAEVRAASTTEVFERRHSLYRGNRRLHFSHLLIQELIERKVFETICHLTGTLNDLSEPAGETNFNAEFMLQPVPLLEEIPFEAVDSDKLHYQPSDH